MGIELEMKTNKQQNYKHYPSDENIPKNPDISEVVFNNGDKFAHNIVGNNKK